MMVWKFKKCKEKHIFRVTSRKVFVLNDKYFNTRYKCLICGTEQRLFEHREGFSAPLEELLVCQQ